jgi:hypothetical protein
LKQEAQEMNKTFYSGVEEAELVEKLATPVLERSGEGRAEGRFALDWIEAA